MTTGIDNADPPEPVGLSFLAIVEGAADFASTAQEVLRQELGGDDSLEVTSLPRRQITEGDVDGDG